MSVHYNQTTRSHIPQGGNFQSPQYQPQISHGFITVKKVHQITNQYDRDSSDGIGTRYGLDGPRIESRWRRDFPRPSRPAHGAHPPSYTMSTGSLSQGLKRPERGANHPPHLAPRLKKDQSYTSTSSLELHGLFQGDLYLYEPVRRSVPLVPSIQTG